MPRGQPRVAWNNAETLLACKRLLTELVPAVIELALVLVRPFFRYVMRRVRSARREVGEERFVRDQRLLLPDPCDRLVGHVRHEVVTLFRRLLRLDRCRPFVNRRIPLMRLATDEAIEVLEAPAAGWPRVKWAGRARLPHRHLVTLAKLRRGIAIQLQRPRDRRRGVGNDGAIARRAGGDLRDAAHADAVMVAAREQRGSRRGA